MKPPDRITRIEAALETALDAIKRLETIASAHQTTIAAHDHQIEQLIAISEQNARNWQNLERQWQAYLNTLPRQ